MVACTQHEPQPGVHLALMQPYLHCRGAAQCGELAYGENGKKSSANPEECQSLKGVHTQQVMLEQAASQFISGSGHMTGPPMAAFGAVPCCAVMSRQPVRAPCRRTMMQPSWVYCLAFSTAQTPAQTCLVMVDNESCCSAESCAARGHKPAC